MKNLFLTIFIALLFAGIMGLSSCEQKVNIESVVHEDGSIDRTIVFTAADSSLLTQNIFGAVQATGWQATTEVIQGKSDTNKKNKITFRKHFPSPEAANVEMNSSGDTLFHIRSEFEKKFRWFYTYIRYSDTYGTVNRFRLVPQSDYFTQEDFLFLDRLPAEGKRLSRADSLYLANLTTKIYDQYATRAFFVESFEVVRQVLLSNKADKKWMDRLAASKEGLFVRMTKKDNGSFGNDFIKDILDSLKIPVDRARMVADYRASSAGMEKLFEFMSDAGEGKYSHHINMPWTIVSTNADSVHGSDVFWQPPTVKFLLRDYTMYAESRELNSWTLIVSAVVILFAAWLLYRQRRK